MSFTEHRLTCERCGSEWLEAHYDYAAVRQRWLAELPARPFNLWRYHELLPISAGTQLRHSGEGGTPLLLADELGRDLAHPAIYVKDERRQPTGSFKDRQAAVAVARMLERGVTECVLASTGNAAAAYAAACARARIKLWVFLTSLVPQEKMREVALYGAEVVKITGTYDQAKQVAADFAARRRLHLDRGARSLAARAGMHTLAYEIAEQLNWQAPDWYVQAVSGGIGPLGVYRGFCELYEMGLIERVPQIALVQVEGCAPMAQAFSQNLETAPPVIPQTRIAILSTGNPGRAYQHLRGAIQAHGGTMIGVSDQEAFQAMHRIARREGLSTEPATAVAFAGLYKLIADGTIPRSGRVVVNCSGHTFPAEKHVVGEDWGTDLDLTRPAPSAPHEGLAAAIEHLDERVTTVVIIDDSPHDGRLIRRLLEAHKQYRVFQAMDGRSGLELVRERLPDLVVLDLMMPEIDGFGVLEQLKADPRTHDIPVFVVSAKDLSADEQRRLQEKADALWQKGALPVQAFVDKVVERIEENDLPE